MRKALVVGIDHYPYIGDLRACVSDARAVGTVLAQHMNGDRNFDVDELTAPAGSGGITRRQLRERVVSIFDGEPDIALLYFAGHGDIDNAGGYLLASDSQDTHDGLALDEVLTFAHKSRAKNKVLIFDSCFSGAAGEPVATGKKALLSDGMTILTASGRDQQAQELHGAGIFTALLVDALEGGAASLRGDITAGSIYAHIDIALGSFGQRPVFKTNVKNFVSLRQVDPPISTRDLRQIDQLFTSPDMDYQLDPSYEPYPAVPVADCPPDPVNTKKFAILQKMNRLNLVVPVDAEHMYYAAMNRKACRLTVLGRHYWNLVNKKRI